MTKRILSVLTVVALVFGLVGLSINTEALENKTWITNSSTAGIPTVEGKEEEWEGIKINALNGKFSPRTTDTQVNAGTILTIPVAANENGANLIFHLSGGSASLNVNGQPYDSDGSQVNIPLEASGDIEVSVEFSLQAYISSIELKYLEPEKEFPGTPGDIEAKDRDYTFESSELLKDESGVAVVNANLEGKRGSFDDILVDATNGKFNVQTDQSRVVINAGTILYIPVTTDTEGVSLMIAGTIDGSTPGSITVDNQNAKTNEKISLSVQDLRYVTVGFEAQTYVSTISVDYGSDTGYGVPEVSALDKAWDFTGTSVVERPDLQSVKGEFDGIQIDALAGKFSPRETDTQINGGTVLYIPVAADQQIAITVTGNNYNNLQLTFNKEEISVGVETFISVDEPTYIPLTFNGEGSCYLTGISVDYSLDNESVSQTVRVGASSLAKYKTIQSALDNETSNAKTPLIIELEDGIYNEKVTIDESYVTLKSISGNPDSVIIQSDYYSSNTFDDEGNFVPQDDKDVGTDQSGTVLLTSKATNFTAYNITFKNSYNIDKFVDKDQQTPAVAFCSNADKVYLNKCQIIGRQDTLYVKGSGNRVYLKDCYIEGTVDFVFGNANAFFDNCTLHMAYYNGKNNGYYTAPNTNDGGQGLVFYQCDLTADSRVEEVSLGRPWQNECYTESIRVNGSNVVTYVDPERKNPNYENISSASMFIDSHMTSQIQNERWNEWTRKNNDGETVSVTYKDTVRFSEFNSQDENGQLLNPTDYNVVLGTMETGDSQTKLAEVLSAMRIGNGLGEWLPDLSANIPEPDNPGLDDPVITPPGEVTDPETGTGTTPSKEPDITVVPDDTQESKDQSTVSSTQVHNTSVQTDDTTQIGIYVVIGVIALAGIVLIGKTVKKKL